MQRLIQRLMQRPMPRRGARRPAPPPAAAVWPDPGRAMHSLGAAAEKALREGRGVALAPDGVSPPSPDQPAHIGYPIEVAGELQGAVVLDVAPCTDAELQRALRLVHWG